MMRLVACAMVLSLCLAVMVSAEEPPMPDMPMVVLGDLTIDGEPADTGAEVTARIDGEMAEEFTVTKPGKYILTIEGTVAETTGKTVSIFVNDQDTGHSLEWKSQDVVELDLIVGEADDEEDNDDDEPDDLPPADSAPPSVPPVIPDRYDNEPMDEEIGGSEEGADEASGIVDEEPPASTGPLPPAEPTPAEGVDLALYLIGLIAVVFITGILIYRGKLSSKKSKTGEK